MSNIIDRAKEIERESGVSERENELISYGSSSSHNANSNSIVSATGIKTSATNGINGGRRQHHQLGWFQISCYCRSNWIAMLLSLLLLLPLNKSKNKLVALYFHNYTIFSRSSFWHLHLILCAWSECEHVCLYRGRSQQQNRFEIVEHTLRACVFVSVYGHWNAYLSAVEFYAELASKQRTEKKHAHTHNRLWYDVMWCVRVNVCETRLRVYALSSTCVCVHMYSKYYIRVACTS